MVFLALPTLARSNPGFIQNGNAGRGQSATKIDCAKRLTPKNDPEEAVNFWLEWRAYCPSVSGCDQKTLTESNS
jgi:hypothetical protein